MAAETQGKIVTSAAGTGHGSDVTPDAGTVSMPSVGTVTTVGVDSSGTARNRDADGSGTEGGTGTGTELTSSSTVPAGLPPHPRHTRARRGLFRRNRGTVTDGSGSGSGSAEDDKAQKGDGDGLLWIVIWSLTAVTTWMAASGQVEVWKWAGLNPHDPRRFGLPFEMELAVIGWLLLGKYAVSRQRSPYPWWVLAFLSASLAVYTNSVHGTWKSALVFGTASAVSLAFWFAKFYIDYIGHQVDKGHLDGARPKVLGVGSWSQPRIDLRAFIIVRRRAQVTTVERARELAEMWIWIYQDTKAKLKKDKHGRGKRATARRTAWMQINIECGVKVIEPQGIKVAGVTFRPTPTPEVIVPATWVEEDRQQRSAPRPPAIRRQQPSSSPISVPPVASSQTPVDDVPADWFVEHKARISAVQDRIGDWATRERLVVDDVQKVIGNRKHAAQVTKCLKVLRQNMTANTTQGGDLQ